MRPLTEPEIRESFVNASRREAREAWLPDLDVDWSALEVFGWTDEKRPGTSYVLVDTDDGPRGIVVRPAAASGPRRKALCSWCEDVTRTDGVVMVVAKRAGAAGRKGDVVGTLVCGDFTCSRNVRRAPLLAEIGAKATDAEREYFQAVRVEALREHARAFLGHVVRD